jgi:hypothetical protein
LDDATTQGSQDPWHSNAGSWTTDEQTRHAAMGNQRFATLAQAQRASVLAREEDGYPGPDALIDPERCAVDVCAIDTPAGAKHLFIVYTNEKGVQYGYRAGPDGGVGSGPLRSGAFLATSRSTMAATPPRPFRTTTRRRSPFEH